VITDKHRQMKVSLNIRADLRKPVILKKSVLSQWKSLAKKEKIVMEKFLN